MNSFSEHFEKRKHVLLNHTPEVWSYYRHLPDDEQRTRLSVCTTWEMSLLGCGRTKIDRESYVRFLTLAAFFSRAPVSQYLFETYHEATRLQTPTFMQAFLSDGVWDSFRYQDFVVQLSAVSLVQCQDLENSSTGFSLHPLVTDWLKLRLDTHALHAYSLEALNILKSVTDKYDGVREILDFKETQSTIAHLSACSAAGITRSDDFLRSIRNATPSFANFYLVADRIEDAEVLLKKESGSSCEPKVKNDLDYVLGRL